jgi:hypothetical protein
MGVPADRIKKALAGFNADALPDGYYRLAGIDGNEDIARILSAIGIDAALPLPTESELRQLKYAIDKSIFM